MRFQYFFRHSDPDLVDARNALLAENWWALALRGLFAIIFGIVAFTVPAATMLALVFFFAAYSLVDGLFNIVLAVKGARRHERWGLLLVNGLFGVVVGIGAALWPGITVLVFVLMIAAWAFVSGALMLGASFGLKTSHGRWLLVFGGVVSLFYGVLLSATPLIGALVLTWWLGAYAVVFGVSLIVLSIRLRSHRGERMAQAMAHSA